MVPDTDLQEKFLTLPRLKRQLVAKFSQSRAVESNVDPNKHGFCAGLTIHWLARRAGGKNWPSPQDTPEAMTLSATAAATYKKYVDSINATSLVETAGKVVRLGAYAATLGGIDAPSMKQKKIVLNNILIDFNMSIDDSKEPPEWNGGSRRKFIHELAVLGEGFYYISITCSKGPHALGLQIQSSQLDADCEFFDPNIGQLHYDDPTALTDSFQNLLAAYLAVHNYDFNEAVAFRVKPPQPKFAP